MWARYTTKQRLVLLKDGMTIGANGMKPRSPTPDEDAEEEEGAAGDGEDGRAVDEAVLNEIAVEAQQALVGLIFGSLPHFAGGADPAVDEVSSLSLPFRCPFTAFHCPFTGFQRPTERISSRASSTTCWHSACWCLIVGGRLLIIVRCPWPAIQARV